MIVAIIPQLSDPKIFSYRTLPQILDYMEDPQTQFIFSDEHPYIARYLYKRGYRRCRIYHTGPSPSHTIGNYRTVGGFRDMKEVRLALESEADLVID